MTELVPVESLNPGDVVEVNREMAASVYGMKSGEAIYQGGGYGGSIYYPSFLTGVGSVNIIKNIEVKKLPESKLVEMEFEKIKLNKSLFAARGYASGTDPEIFVLGGDGEVMPARGFLEDKKFAKEDCSTGTGGGFSGRGWPTPPMFYDGLQAEFCPPGASCLESLHEGTRMGLAGVLRKARIKDPKARLTLRNSIKISPERMVKLSDEDVRFRCSTSMNIYDDLGEQPEARQYLWRFAGGHVHIGMRRKTPQVLRAIVKSLDGMLGLAGVSMAANWDNPERRRMYGRAGEFRLPKHGLEYRVLSNFWLCHPVIVHLTFEIMRWATGFGEQGFFSHLWEGSEEEVRDIINWCDVDGARKMLGKNRYIFEAIIGNVKKVAWKPRQTKLALETILNGLEVVVKNPEDFEGNWLLNDMENKVWKQYGRGENQQWSTLKV